MPRTNLSQNHVNTQQVAAAAFFLHYLLILLLFSLHHSLHNYYFVMHEKIVILLKKKIHMIIFINSRGCDIFLWCPALFQVRIWTPPPLPQKWPYLCPLCWTEWKINFPIFIFASYGWLYLQFTSSLPQFSSVSPTKKMLSKVSKFTRKMRNDMKRIF